LRGERTVEGKELMTRETRSHSAKAKINPGKHYRGLARENDAVRRLWQAFNTHVHTLKGEKLSREQGAQLKEETNGESGFTCVGKNCDDNQIVGCWGKDPRGRAKGRIRHFPRREKKKLN